MHAVPDEVANAPDSAHFGRFVRVAKLGAGGMGEVWKAWDGEAGRWIALKILAESQGANTDWVKRFRREATAAARLDHPGIVKIFDVGICASRHFIAMELVEGETAADVAERGDCSPARALEIVAAAADALEVAHAAGVVHRDLKPGNILLGADDRVVLTDFGVAHDEEASAVLTREGDALGTPAYMSPEQVRARRGTVGPQADVYGLGAVLYELLCGSPPFTGDSPFKVLYDVVSEDPVKPSTLRDGIPRQAEQICLIALEKSPEKRQPGAAAFAAQCRKAAAKLGHGAPGGESGQISKPIGGFLARLFGRGKR